MTLAAALPWPLRTGIGPWRRRRAGLDPCPETELDHWPPSCWTWSAELALTAQTHGYAAPPWIPARPRARSWGRRAGSLPRGDTGLAPPDSGRGVGEDRGRGGSRSRTLGPAARSSGGKARPALVQVRGGSWGAGGSPPAAAVAQPGAADSGFNPPTEHQESPSTADRRLWPLPPAEPQCGAEAFSPAPGTPTARVGGVAAAVRGEPSPRARRPPLWIPADTFPREPPPPPRGALCSGGAGRL